MTDAATRLARKLLCVPSVLRDEFVFSHLEPFLLPQHLGLGLLKLGLLVLDRDAKQLAFETRPKQA